jgi:hypothetical protein
MVGVEIFEVSGGRKRWVVECGGKEGGCVSAWGMHVCGRAGHERKI